MLSDGPGDGAYALDFARKGFAGFEVLDVEGVLAEAGEVDGVGEPAAIVGDVGGTDGEEGLAFGELVSVENDLLQDSRDELVDAALAAEDAVLLSFFGAEVVPPVAFAVGGGLVGLLDVAEHLVVELVAEGSEVGGMMASA